MREHGELSAGTLGGKLGCFAAALTGLALWAALWFLSFYGTCHEGDPCRRGEGRRALIVIGIVAVVATVVGLFVRSVVNRRVARNVE
jgi:membrane protein DedA with SNARE-associated domain